MKIKRTTELVTLNGALEEKIATMGRVTSVLPKTEASQLANTRTMVNLLKFGHRLWKFKDKLGSVKGTSVKPPMVNTNKFMVFVGNMSKERKK